MIFSEILHDLSEAQIVGLYEKWDILFQLEDCHAMQKRLAALNVIEDDWFPLFTGYEECPECHQKATVWENHVSHFYRLQCSGSTGSKEHCGKWFTKWKEKGADYYKGLMCFYYKMDEDDAIENDERY